ncbi:hypothetical protein IU459_34575 [Nocardia amamiensis]|uniref:Uncharacterized protein n=1 Tax=Nocardia amamiensis TaxID=404578 RepID=A0ABS0D1F5_9NOCA|nr:hypothetical protein [Nocardia amamiensis]MBF6302625.1 hypothetical protein [Nocardia amamiensis]
MKPTTPRPQPHQAVVAVEIVKRQIDDSLPVASGLDVQHDDQLVQLGVITGAGRNAKNFPRLLAALRTSPLPARRPGSLAADAELLEGSMSLSPSACL